MMQLPKEEKQAVAELCQAQINPSYFAGSWLKTNKDVCPKFSYCIVINNNVSPIKSFMDIIIFNKHTEDTQFHISIFFSQSKEI